MVFFGVFGVYIIPNWLIKVPGHFGILFGWFLELRKFCQNLVPEPSGLSPKCFNKYKKKYGIILENIMFVNRGHPIFRKCSKSVCPRYQCFFLFCFVCLFFRFYRFFMLFFEYIFWKMRRWGIENYTFFIIKQHPNLNLNFIYGKKHEMEITLNFVFSRNVPWTFPKEGTLNFLSRKVP